MDYSSILDDSNEDNYEIETASASTSKPKIGTANISTSKPDKATVKKRVLSTSSVQNKRQRRQGDITSLLQLSDSEDGKGNGCLYYGRVFSD